MYTRVDTRLCIGQNCPSLANPHPPQASRRLIAKRHWGSQQRKGCFKPFGVWRNLTFFDFGAEGAGIEPASAADDTADYKSAPLPLGLTLRIKRLAALERLELSTFRLATRRSIRLSYRAAGYTHPLHAHQHMHS